MMPRSKLREQIESCASAFVLLVAAEGSTGSVRETVGGSWDGKNYGSWTLRFGGCHYTIAEKVQVAQRLPTEEA
jgi:hypothetical protein